MPTVIFFKKRELHAFELGLAVRVFLILAAIPTTYSDWFLPFLLNIETTESSDIWRDFLDKNGDPVAFPYGPLFSLVFGPLTLAGHMVAGERGAGIGLGTMVLIADTLLFLTLRQLVQKSDQFWITYTYWCSPIVIYCCYWHGQLDVLPVLFLVAAFFGLRSNRLRTTGLALGVATASKFSMGVALPFFGVFFWGDRRYRHAIPTVVVWIGMASLTLLPFLFLESFRQMVFATPETLKLFSLNVRLTDTVTIYILPLALFSLVYAAWRVRRFDEHGLFAFVGLAFFLLFLLTPASPGWAIWVLPFLAVHMARGGETDMFLGWVFSVAVVVYHLFVSSGPILFSLLDFGAPIISFYSGDSRIPSLLFSIVFLSGAMVTVQIFRASIYRSHFFELGRKPILISIAGESGSGKDTISNALRSLFGERSTVAISGDDYHNWDRRNPMWQAFTHLHPSANDIPTMEKDVLALKNRRSVRLRHYDHQSGRMTKPRKLDPRDIVLFSGLHALYLPVLRHASDVSVYLDMEESLRRRFKFRRDVEERGHLLEVVENSLKLREKDSEIYIRPQKKEADLVLRLIDVQPSSANLELAVKAEFSFEFDTGEFYRVAFSLGACEIRREIDENGRSVMTCFGPYDSGAIQQVAKQVAPQSNGMLSLQPNWTDDVTGIMELCILLCLEQKRFKGQRYDS